VATADVGDPSARFQRLADSVERLDPVDQVGAVGRPEEAFGAVKDVFVVFVPADPLARSKASRSSGSIWAADATARNAPA